MACIFMHFYSCGGKRQIQKVYCAKRSKTFSEQGAVEHVFQVVMKKEDFDLILELEN